MTKSKNQTVRPMPWSNMPKWLWPFAVIGTAVAVFFIAQYAASLIVSVYPLARGFSAARANSWLTNSVTAQFFYILFAEGFTIGLVYLILRRYKKTLSSIGLDRVPKAKHLLWALIGYPVYLLIFIVMLNIVTHLYPGLNVNQAQQIGFTSVHGTYQLVLTFISLVILPPLAEEILFRGFMFEGLKKAMPPIYAGILTSALFASAHLPEGGSAGLLWVGAIDTFILSLVLVYLKQKSKSLWPGIFLHAAKNIVAFVSLFLLTNR